MKVEKSNAAQRTVVVSGTLDQLGRAFAVTLGLYQTPSQTYRGSTPFQIAPPRIGPTRIDHRVRQTASPGRVLGCGALEEHGELVAEPVGISGAGFDCCVDETGSEVEFVRVHDVFDPGIASAASTAALWNVL